MKKMNRIFAISLLLCSDCSCAGRIIQRRPERQRAATIAGEQAHPVFFADQHLQQLYDDLVAQGSKSLVTALIFKSLEFCPWPDIL